MSVCRRFTKFKLVEKFVRKPNENTIEVSLNSSDSIKLIELIWKTMIGSLERAFLLPILYLLYIVLLLLVTVK